MIVHIDFPQWIRIKGLSHKTRHIYLNLLVLTTAVPKKEPVEWARTLGLTHGQWVQVRTELKRAGLFRQDKLKPHPAVMLTKDADGK